jgi:hypothetical protein
MKKSNRYASFLLRLWQRETADETELVSWQGEIEHIQSGKVLPFIQMSNLPALLSQIVLEDRSNNPEENKNE